MKSCSTIASAIIGLLVSGNALSASCDFDDFPVPATAETQWLMQNVIYNNVSLNVKTFRADSDRESVLEFYRKRWEDQFSESSIDWWQQILRFEKGCMLQVQVGEDDDKRAFGRLVMTPTGGKNAAPALGDGIDTPSGTLTLMDMRSSDDYKAGRTLVFTNKLTAYENIAYFRTSLLSRGWHIEMQQNLVEGQVLVATRKADRISLVIHETADQTQILYNHEAID